MKKQLLFLILGIFFISLVSAQFTENISVTTGWNEIEFSILPSNNSLFNVLSSISGKYSQIKTQINGQVDMWAEDLPPFAIDLYNINFNQTYLIEMKNDSVIELIGEPNPLVPYLLNTSWSDWYDISECYHNWTKQQEKNLTEYDYNGILGNTTHYEYNEVPCNYGTYIEICDSGCNYTRVRDAIDDLYCYDHIEREFNFTNCTQLNESLRAFVHNGNRSRFEIVNLSNIEVFGESKAGVEVHGDNIYSNVILKGVSNITVKNYTMDNGWQGVWMKESNNVLFEDIDFKNDYNYAIFMTNNSDNNTVRRVTCNQIDNQSCFRIHLYSDNNIFEYVEAQNAWYNGVVVAYHVRNNTIRHSILHDNGYDGIFVGTNASYNRFINNTYYNNGGSCQRFYLNSNYNYIDGMDCWNATDDGIIIKNNSMYNYINNSYTHHNNDNGVFIWQSNNNTFNNLTSQFNYWHCISNAESNYTTVTNSLLTNTWNRSGIYTEYGDYFYVNNTKFMHNDVGVFNLNASYALIENSYFENNSEGVYINSRSREVNVLNSDFYLNHIGIWISVILGSPEDDSIRINNTHANQGCDVDYSSLGCQEDYSNPGPINDLSAWSSTTNKEIRLNFTSSGDNYINGSNYGYYWDNSNEDYIVKYYHEPITIANWDNASTYIQGWTPLTSGNVENRWMNMPDYGYYWIAIQAIDDNGRKNNISNSVQVLSPHWEIGIYDLECRNKRTLWGCNESDGVSSPTTNYWFDTFTYNMTVNNTGNVEQTRPTYAYIKEGGTWIGENDPIPFANQFNYNFTLGPGQSVDLGNVDVILNHTEEGYQTSVASIKNINPDACGPFSPGMQCGRSPMPWSSRNYRTWSMKKHLSFVIDPEHWGDSVVPIETGNNTANSPFYMDLFFCNNNTQIYYNHVPFNFTINTTYPWEINDVDGLKCGSGRGYEVHDPNDLQKKYGWYHLSSNSCDYANYCTWNISSGLPPGIYNFTYSTGYYEEDSPPPVSIVGRFV